MNTVYLMSLRFSLLSLLTGLVYAATQKGPLLLLLLGVVVGAGGGINNVAYVMLLKEK